MLVALAPAGLRERSHPDAASVGRSLSSGVTFAVAALDVSATVPSGGVTDDAIGSAGSTTNQTTKDGSGHDGSSGDDEATSDDGGSDHAATSVAEHARPDDGAGGVLPRTGSAVALLAGTALGLIGTGYGLARLRRLVSG